MTVDRPGAARAAFAEQLMDESRDALIAISFDGLILSWSRGAEAMFGHAAQVALGQPIDSLIVPKEYQPEARQARSQASETGVVGIESVRRHKDGSLIDVSVSMRRISGASAEPFIAVSTQDITELKRLRDGQQNVRETNGLNSEFLTSLSHALRSPLNAIIGFAELMHKGKVGPVSAPHEEYLGDILTSSNHLLQLINDVLDLAKVESGKIALRPESVDLTKLVAEVRDILRGLAAAKKLQIETVVDRDFNFERVPVVVDPARLKQVVYSYLSNAIKFTPEFGCITVRILGEGPDLFRIVVEDAGMGVRPEDIDKVFLELQDIDARAAGKVQGAGLGLALTKRIVEAHGGRVEVTSAPGMGSTFSAILPRRTAAPKPQSRTGENRIGTPVDTLATPGLVSGS